MTVCITGDVHHMSMETRDQKYLTGTEVEAAIEYAEIAASYDVPVTLFLTGKCIDEEPDRVQRLASMENVELGGHNYWAFTTPVHSAWRALAKLSGGRVGSWNGPQTFQAWEIRKTIAAFERVDTRITCWRDHAYRHDSHTANLLVANGITHFSDLVAPEGTVRRESGLIIVPVNTPPDHEHVYHAFRTPEFVADSTFEGPFGTETREPESWLSWVLDCIQEREAADSPATVLAHPACMRLADEFDTLEELCAQAAGDALRLTEIES